MNNIKQRLAKANGMNSMLCFRAKDEINRLEKEAHKIEDLFLLMYERGTSDPSIERFVEAAAAAIVYRQSKRKRWNFEDSKSV